MSEGRSSPMPARGIGVLSGVSVTLLTLAIANGFAQFADSTIQVVLLGTCIASVVTTFVLFVFYRRAGPIGDAVVAENARLRQVLESAPDGVVITDATGIIRHANQRLASILGYDPQEVIGQPIELLVPDSLTTAHENHRRTYLENPVVKPMALGRQLCGRHKDGASIPLSISLSPIAETAGDIIAIVRDVTEHRAFEERVRQSERRLAEAQRLAHLGSWDWDIVGNALKWSDEMCRIFGTTQEEFGGDYQAFLGALHDDDRARVQEAVSRAVDGVEPYETDYRVVHPDSTERIVHAQGEVTFTCDGMPTRMFGTVLDITDRRHAEEELEKYRSHLEDIVEERTRELEEARDRAEAADKLKSAFLAAMSHELRTPLNSIIGFVGILLKELPGPLNDEQQLQLGMVQTSSRHLLELINDVLDISKLEADQLELRVAPFDMQDSVEKVLKTVSPLAEEKKLSLVSDVRLDERQLTSDSRRVEQILLNLVGNAIKFTDRGSVTIECTANQELITTRISDTGIGIRSEDIGSVFESFRQVDSGLSRQREGTGLGLSISKKLVEMLGGTIGCQSTLGVGSTFEFSLPLLWKD